VEMRSTAKATIPHAIRGISLVMENNVDG